ncbi:glycosyltransferase family 4 protein [Nocardia sp. 348MFTsu5.1]|uniref:glycosyltransferase family 4 protein n=1 Tax=Nocardia sp. 348MFTsu5.1 TaxID=1172185 RepID=UPI00039E2427|nr:glycosyltransferase family 4 protein [Nocardia sp. 348MFTsu5.1]
MRVLFYPKTLRLGDSERGAVEMAGAMVAAGHEVMMIAAPGILAARVHELGIELLLIPDRPADGTFLPVRRLVKVIRERSIEVVHAFEWEAIDEAFLAANLSRRQVAVTGTIHARGDSPILPHSVALLVGSKSAAGELRTQGFTRVSILEPWVDTENNGSGRVVVGEEFVQRRHLDSNGLVVALAIPLDDEASLVTLVTAIESVGEIAAEGTPVQLLVVGDGSLLGTATECAADFNARSGREVVVVAGEMIDRRAALAVADVVVASGSSVAQGMALGKPVVVAGERGFFRPLSHATIDEFSWSGWYGVGSGNRLGKVDLLAALEPLLESSRLRDYRGAYAREVVSRYGLDHAFERQLEEYGAAFDTRVGRLTRLIDMCRVAAALIVRRRLCVRRVTRRRTSEIQTPAVQARDKPVDPIRRARCGHL